MKRSRTTVALLAFSLLAAACSGGSGDDAETAGEPTPTGEATPDAVTPTPDPTPEPTASPEPDDPDPTTQPTGEPTDEPDVDDGGGLDDERRAIVEAMTDELLFTYNVPYGLFIETERFDCFLSTYVAGAALEEFEQFGLPESGGAGAEQWLFSIDYDQHIRYWEATVDCVGTTEIVINDIVNVEGLLQTGAQGAPDVEYTISDAQATCLFSAAESDAYRDFQWYLGFEAAPDVIAPETQAEIFGPWIDCLGVSTFLLAAFAHDLLPDDAVRQCVDEQSPDLAATVAERGELTDLFFRFFFAPPSTETAEDANAAISACT